MENCADELLVVSGPLEGRRFKVTQEGIRLGRSSSCEISISDPLLSRNQCLFELRDGEVYVTDLASANGTQVNGEDLDTLSRVLNRGDRIFAGDSEIVLVEEGMNPPEIGDSETSVDLGLSRSGDDENEEAKSPGGHSFRLVLWALLVLVLGGSAAAILFMPMGDGAIPLIARPLSSAKISSLSYEKVEATVKGICRYAVEVDASGNIRAQLDDVPDNDRHINKTAKLSDKARQDLDKLLSSDLFKLEKEYVGAPRPGELNRYEIRIVRGNEIFGCVVENTAEPEAFRSVRLALETFSQNELGIWAIQYSAEKLTEMSQEARIAADAKWEERDVNYGNLSAALKLYDEAVMDLETVNPKPQDYSELITKRDMVRAELDRRYKDQRFEVDRAVNMGDWERAVRELKILCELVPDSRDPRHVEAVAKLVDVENRMKKGSAK
jgi:hypothetical protein